MKRYTVEINWWLLVWWAMVIAALVYALTGCAFIRNIPAVSTPLREVRYYRTQDAANLAGGAACNMVIGLVVRDTTPLASVARVGTCAVAGLVRRQTDRGYRESGAMFVTIGTLSWELGRKIVAWIRGTL